MDTNTCYRTLSVGEADVFYREAGSRDAPTILLLHGFPTSSHMFETLIVRLAATHHVVAPDLPGFGLTRTPPRGAFAYTFGSLAEVIGRFVDALGLRRYALYVFDYGAPVGFRLAAAHPERVSAIVSQNGNAYEDGLGPAWAGVRRLWADPSQANRDALLPAFTPDGIRGEYMPGIDSTRLSPDSYALDALHFRQRPGNDDIQLDLFHDYRNNVALYPAWQAYLRTHQPPVLAIWGRHDPYFIPPGAEAFRRDVPAAEVRLLDTGHFALLTHGAEIANAMIDFLAGIP